MELRYDNLTISGGPAVGKDTLKDNLKAYLEPLGWKFRNIGDIHRQYLKDNVMPEAVKVTDEFDRKIEDQVEKILRTEKHNVISAWLSGFVARDIPTTLRVLLVCHDNALRVDRIANRDKVTIEEAKQFIKKREEGNIEKYKRLYGDHDFWNPAYYNLVIDTYAYGQIETTDKVLAALGYEKKS